jgi:hypothetical protein
MAVPERVSAVRFFVALATATFGLFGCAAVPAAPPARPTAAPTNPPARVYFTPPRADPAPRMMLGIDALRGGGRGVVLGAFADPAAHQRHLGG